MNRDEAYKLMCQMIQNANLRKHGLAVEAIMKELCKSLHNRHLEQSERSQKQEISLPINRDRNDNNAFDEEEWGIVGLLHDADYELIAKDPDRHTLVTEEKLREAGVINERIINGIKAHHELIKPNRENLMEKAVYCADELSGLITACALVRPDKKLASLTVESVMKKFKQSSFAAGAKREQISVCEKELGIPLEEFIGIALKAMQGISSELGL